MIYVTVSQNNWIGKIISLYADLTVICKFGAII